MIYGNQGQVVNSYDFNGNETQYSYDATGIFPSEVQRPSTNGVAHNDWYTFDPVLGKPRSHTDENGSGAGDPAHTARAIRLHRSSWPPDFNNLSSGRRGGTQRPILAYNDTARSITTTLHASPDPSLISTITYDGFGRTTSVVGRNGAEVDTIFDGLGRVATVSTPYFPGSGQGSTTPAYTSILYDALGRKTRLCKPSASSSSQALCQNAASGLFESWSYAGNTTTFQDEAGNSSSSTEDALGHLTQTMELGSTSNPLQLETDYGYSPLGDLTSVNQLGASGATPRSRTFTYDSLSRLVSASFPETGTICYGTIQNLSSLWTAATRKSASSKSNKCMCRWLRLQREIFNQRLMHAGSRQAIYMMGGLNRLLL